MKSVRSSAIALTLLATALAAACVGFGTSTAATAATASAAAEQVRALSGHDQGAARREMRAGNQLSLRQIEQRILPRMRESEYLGPSYDSRAHAYRLKFIRDGRVTYIDVDARTGRIISRSD